MLPEHTNAQAQRSHGGRALILALALGVLAVFAMLFLRYGQGALNPLAEGPAGTATLPTSTTLPTATALNGDTMLGGGTVVAAATPYSTPIMAGFARPDGDNGTQQQLRAEAGNPKKVIIISIDGQYIQAWENNKLVKWSYVTTGKPDTPTPTGSYKVGFKLSPYTFSSAAPRNSAGWYYPTKGVYALYFAEGGYFIHDSWWRTVYGPGLTTWHFDPSRDEYQTGSHGCVNTPIEMMGWLFVWSDVGTEVLIY